MYFYTSRLQGSEDRNKSTFLMLTLLCTIISLSLCCADGEQVTCGRRTIRTASTRENVHEELSDVGVSSNSLSRQKKIVGGQQALRGDVPWQARIDIIKGTETGQCGATILSEYWLLTAAHCYINGSNSTVYVGDYEIDGPDEGEQIFDIDEFIYHINYFVLDKDNNSSGYDIALVKIKANNGHGIIFNDFVQPACLPEPNSEIEENTLCVASGWGATKDGDSFVDILRYAYMPIVNQSSCLTYYRELNETLKFTDKWFCAGYIGGGNDTCLGDSGGPLVCDYDGKITVYGITSWGNGCGEGPGFYTNVLVFLPWIKENMH